MNHTYQTIKQTNTTRTIKTTASTWISPLTQSLCSYSWDNANSGIFIFKFQPISKNSYLTNFVHFIHHQIVHFVDPEKPVQGLMINLVHFNHPYRNPLPPIGNQRCIQPCIGCQSMKLPLATFTDLMFLLYFIIHFFLMMAGSYTSQGLIQSTLDVRWPKKVRKLLRNIKISSRTSKKICRRMERLERKKYVKSFSARK